MDINLDTNIDDLIRENLKDIGARIKDIRKRLRISQMQMAETIRAKKNSQEMSPAFSPSCLYL